MVICDTINVYRAVEVKVSGNAEYDLTQLILSVKGDTFVWSDDDILPLLAELPENVLAILYKEGAVKWFVNNQLWDIFYAPSKILCIEYNHGGNSKIYFLQQYFPDYSNPGIDGAQRCADELEHALHQMQIFNPKKLSSPAAIFESFYAQHLDLPDWIETKGRTRGKLKDCYLDYEPMFEYAAKCAGIEWDELHRIGSFPDCFSYDIRGAYSHQMAHLLDNRPKYMSIRESSEYIENADYGYIKGIVEINSKVKIHPIPHLKPDGSIDYPTGAWRGYFTKQQLDFITHWKIGAYEITNGWWLKANKQVKPLEAIVARMLAWKENDNPLIKDLAKRMVNGFGGKFNEEWKTSVGYFYNPMWHSEIVTRSAMKVCGAIYHALQRGEMRYSDIIQVKVDEFKLNHQIPTPQGFKETSGECLAITPEDVFFGKQHPDNWTLDGVKEILTAHPGMGYYEKKIQRMVNLATAHKRGNLKEVGKVKDEVIAVDLFRNNPSRDFKELPMTGKEVLENIYHSNPYFVEEA